MLVVQSSLTLCSLMDCSPPGFSVHGILQVRILEQEAIPFSRGYFLPGDWTQVSCITRGFFIIWARYSIFMDRNTQYCQYVSSSQLDLLIQSNLNQILARSFCGYLPTYSEGNEEKQKTQNSQFINEEKEQTLPNFNQDSMDWWENIQIDQWNWIESP